MKQNYLKKIGKAMLIALCLTSVNGFGQLYPFSSHTFTNAGSIGKEGPTLVECQTAYSAEVWELDPAFFNMTTQGIQEWTVPITAIYEIEAYGAQGGNDLYTIDPEDGGLGTQMIGTFSLTEGDVLYILVGQKGEDTRVTGADNAAAGGGGGTFVWDPTDTSNPLIAAGAGAGGSGQGDANRNSTDGIDGLNATNVTNGGIAGNGGRNNNLGSSYWAGGGAGWLTNGTGGRNSTDYDYIPGSSAAEGGRRALEGGIGGLRHNDGLDEGGDGGFGGGGGGGSDNMGTGGGGGYSGGGGDNGTGSPDNSGGGGGSYNAGTDQDNIAAINSGMGSVKITILCEPIVITATGIEVCDGELTNLTGVSVSGAAVSWSGGVSNGVDFTAPVGTTIYTVSTADIDDCTSQIEIVVDALPTVIATADFVDVCEGEDVTLMGTGTDSYVWDMGVVDGVTFTPPVGVTTYTVLGTDAATSCENTDFIEITVYALPIVTANASDAHICLGESIILTGGGATDYVWDPVDVVDGVSFEPLTTGTFAYTVTGTDINECSNSASVDVNVYDVITITYTTIDETLGSDGEIDITVTGGNPTYGFDWDNDGTGDYDDTEDLTGLVAGTYTVLIIDDAGCQATETIVVSGQVGINEANNANIVVYPNPTVGNVTIELAGAFEYQLTAINGDVLFVGTAVDKENISISQFADGIYFITLKTDTLTKTVKVIKK